MSVRNRLLPLLLLVSLFGLNAQAATYYIAANGSDANGGTSKTTPWLHAPGMTGCSGNCAAKTPQPGDQFIFRGGDAWHFSGRGTPVGLDWTWQWSGASANPIYIGVDKTWFAGGSWARPILTGDNPISKTPVASCAAGSDAGNGVYVWLNGVSYVTFDNFEFTGYCWSGSPSFGDGLWSTTGSNCTFSNNYIHGWTHTSFSGGTGDGVTALVASSQATGDVGNQYIFNVLDGSDSDETSFGFLTFGGYDVHNNVVRHTAQAIVTNNTKYFYGNLFEYINNSSKAGVHSNAFELNGSNTDLYWYNNVFRHNNVAVNIWLHPGGNGYIYNNVVYDIANSGTNYIAFCGAGGTMYLYNNTFQNNAGNPYLIGNTNTSQCPSGASAPWIATNNHFITDTGSGFGAIFATVSSVSGSNDVYQTNAVAGGQGYAAANNYAPTSAGDATLGAGSNLTGSCGTIFSALCSDTTLAVSYDAVNHVAVAPGRTANARPAGGAWDAGAYQFNGAPPPPPSSSSPCDVNKDNTTNIVDVQQCVNQSLGVATCTADINKDGICNVVDVQRVVNAALGGQCVSP